MVTLSNLIESLVESTEAYGKTTYNLSKLKLLETATHVVTSALTRLGVIIMFSLSALVLSIAIALLLGDVLGKPYYGFLIIAAFYLVAGIVFFFFLHKWIKRPVSKSIIKEALQ